jgi:hypothetical protein
MRRTLGEKGEGRAKKPALQFGEEAMTQRNGYLELAHILVGEPVTTSPGYAPDEDCARMVNG